MFIRDLRLYVIRPALQIIDLWSARAEVLLAATVAVETNGEYLVQEGNVKDGGLGIYQIEPSTHQDVKRWIITSSNRLGNYKNLLPNILSTCYIDILPSDDEPLIYNLRYATLIARLLYYRVKEPIPMASDASALLEYYIKYYNAGGKATFDKDIEKFKEVCAQDI